MASQSIPHSQSERILIITPAKDEAEYIQKTIASLENQTFRPAMWVIVNDGSSDATGALADEAAAKHDWIKVIHRPSGTQRRVGPGVIEAFYVGLESEDTSQFDFVMKMDADIEIKPGYFENLICRFRANPTLGTASGKCWVPVDDELVLERTSDEFSHGVAKLFRRECFEQIGGFVREVMWDGIDCHHCRMHGWEAVSLDDPELRIIHLRLMGSSFKSIYHGRRRWGKGQYFMGTHPLYLLGITAYRMAERPWILGGLSILTGYITAALTKAPRYENPEFRKFLRKWQLAELGRRITGRRNSALVSPTTKQQTDSRPSAHNTADLDAILTNLDRLPATQQKVVATTPIQTQLEQSVGQQ